MTSQSDNRFPLPVAHNAAAFEGPFELHALADGDGPVTRPVVPPGRGDRMAQQPGAERSYAEQSYTEQLTPGIKTHSLLVWNADNASTNVSFSVDDAKAIVTITIVVQTPSGPSSNTMVLTDAGKAANGTEVTAYANNQPDGNGGTFKAYLKLQALPTEMVIKVYKKTPLGYIYVPGQDRHYRYQSATAQTALLAFIASLQLGPTQFELEASDPRPVAPAPPAAMHAAVHGALAEGISPDEINAFLTQLTPPSRAIAPQVEGETGGSPITLPTGTELSSWQANMALQSILTVLPAAPAAVIAALRAGANRYNVTIGIGPAASIGVGAGISGGVGILFAPGNVVGY